MKRLLINIKYDALLQFRNGFYYAAAFVLLLFALGLSRLREVNWGWLLPLILLTNMNITAFYFIGGLVLLEKDEGSLEARIITPLEISEYLLSKIITLTFLASAESLILAVLLSGADFRFLFLTGGIGLASVYFILAGFIAVSRYDSISDFLLPSIGYGGLASLPLLTAFAGWEHPLLYLHPLQAALVILKAAFIPVKSWNLVYGFVYGGIWIILLFNIGQRVFWRFVVSKIGGN